MSVPKNDENTSGNTNLGLELHSSSSEPVNFFEAQSSLGGGHNFHLGGHKQSFGGHGPGMPPRGAGSAYRIQHLYNSVSAFITVK